MAYKAPAASGLADETRGAARGICAPPFETDGRAGHYGAFQLERFVCSGADAGSNLPAATIAILSIWAKKPGSRELPTPV